MVNRALAAGVVSAWVVACAGRSMNESPDGGSGSGGKGSGATGGGRSTGARATGGASGAGFGDDASAESTPSAGTGGTGPAASGGGSGGPFLPAGWGGQPDEVTGYGGSSGSQSDPCEYPPVDVELSDWVELETPPAVDEAAKRVGTGMIGEWYGIAKTPWTPPYVVTFAFTEDGGYSAACTWSSDECCRALNYGTDRDSALKHWELDGVTPSGEVTGIIDVIFGYEGEPDYESGYQGRLQGIVLDATSDRLRFQMMYGQYGPLEYDLQRQGEAPVR
jgi:hypothetical protein